METTKDDERRAWLEARILEEHSKAQTMRIVQWVGHDADRFCILMEVFLQDPPSNPLSPGKNNQPIITQRSAWAVRYVAENAPEIMQAWLDRLIQNLSQPMLHDAIIRNTLNVFEHLDFPERFDETLADFCFHRLASPSEAIATRCASMTILEKVCSRIPELKTELKLLLEDQVEHSSAGFKSRAKKVLSRLK